MTYSLTHLGMNDSALWRQRIDFAAFLPVTLLERSALALTYGRQGQGARRRRHSGVENDDHRRHRLGDDCLIPHAQADERQRTLAAVGGLRRLPSGDPPRGIGSRADLRPASLVQVL